MVDAESITVSWILSPIGLLVTAVVIAIVVAVSVIHIINNK